MTFYDDELDCPRCSRHLSAADLCEHDDPLCPRCCSVDWHEQLAYEAFISLGFRRLVA